MREQQMESKNAKLTKSPDAVPGKGVDGVQELVVYLRFICNQPHDFYRVGLGETLLTRRKTRVQPPQRGGA